MTKKTMRKLLISIIVVLAASAFIPCCTEENVKPADGDGRGQVDRCQFGGPGCPPERPPSKGEN